MSTYYQPHKLPTVRPPWLAMILTTVVASQIAAGLFLWGVCTYLDGGCQFKAPQIVANTARAF